MEVVELAPLLTEQQAKHSCQPGRPGVEAIQTQHRFMMAGLVRQLSQVSAYAADIMDNLSSDLTRMGQRLENIRSREKRAWSRVKEVQDQCNKSLGVFDWQE